MPPDLTVRPATVEDADDLADLFLASRAASYPAIPHPVHPPDGVRRWLRSRFDAERTEVWLAEDDPAAGDDPAGPVGLLLVEDAWLHSLYVLPGRTGQGVGAVLLDVAKSLRPEGLGLWVFETNERARRFYAAHGFVEVRRTDGSGPDGNEEQQPDIEMRWPGARTEAATGLARGSLEELRRRIDGIDDQVAVLLAERARLTAAVQALKPVPGHAGRDPDREREIAERMALAAPDLGPERLARIMHRVITESLDAAADAQNPPGRPPG
jgi:chorismate mutase/GNAT superfamily N-acetyltransferase